MKQGSYEISLPLAVQAVLKGLISNLITVVLNTVELVIISTAHYSCSCYLIAFWGECTDRSIRKKLKRTTTFSLTV